MMWFRFILMSIGSCTALRTHSAVGATKERKVYRVEVALSLTQPQAVEGSSVDIAVNGVRHVSRVHPTQEGSPVVLPYIPRGSVVTAHVHSSEEACAYWVGTGQKQLTVGGWDLDFAVFDEDNEKSTQLFEAYVKVVNGHGLPVTVEVDHVTAKTFNSVKPDEVFEFPSLQRNTLIKVVSASGDTCLHRVGNGRTKCTLDHSWALFVGSAAEKKNDLDEGSIGKEAVKNYTMEISVAPGADNPAPVIELELNGHHLAQRATATPPERPIKMHHVEGGGVITMVSHMRGEACSAYVGTGIQNQTCAGWTINYVLQDEIDRKFDRYDVKYSGQRLSTNTSGKWKMKFGDFEGSDIWWAMLFPEIKENQHKGDRIVPMVNGVESPTCVHIVGGDETSCKYDGWFFTIESYLNMNPDGWQSAHWEYIDDGSDDDWDGPRKIKMTAFDTTGPSSKSWFECIALEDMNYRVAPLGEKNTFVKTNHTMFKQKNLMYGFDKLNKNPKLKSASMIVEFELANCPLFDGGFRCTVYDGQSNKMCEAHSEGATWTTVTGCTMEIEWME